MTLKAAAEAYNHILEPLDKKISKYINGNPIRIDGKPRASGILDTVSSKEHKQSRQLFQQGILIDTDSRFHS
jgi:hypothetical protein